MGFFDVEDGEGGSAEDRIAIVAVACFAVAWIPIMLVWKCISIARRRRTNLDVGNMPVTTHNPDPEKYPLPYKGSPYDGPRTRDDSSRPSHRRHGHTSTDADAHADMPRRPEPLAGAPRHKSTAGRSHRRMRDSPAEGPQHRGDTGSVGISLNSSKHDKGHRGRGHSSSQPHSLRPGATGSPYNATRRSREDEHYPGDPLRIERRGKEANEADRYHRSSPRHQDAHEGSANSVSHDKFEELLI